MRGLRKFFRGGLNLITFLLVYKGIEGPNTTTNGPSLARQRNAIKWRFTGRPMMAQELNDCLFALCFFRRYGPVLQRNPIFL